MDIIKTEAIKDFLERFVGNEFVDMYKALCKLYKTQKQEDQKPEDRDPEKILRKKLVAEVDVKLFEHFPYLLSHDSLDVYQKYYGTTMEYAENTRTYTFLRKNHFRITFKHAHISEFMELTRCEMILEEDKRCVTIKYGPEECKINITYGGKQWCDRTMKHDIYDIKNILRPTSQYRTFKELLDII